MTGKILNFAAAKYPLRKDPTYLEVGEFLGKVGIAYMDEIGRIDEAVYLTGKSPEETIASLYAFTIKRSILVEQVTDIDKYFQRMMNHFVYKNTPEAIEGLYKYRPDPTTWLND